MGFKRDFKREYSRRWSDTPMGNVAGFFSALKYAIFRRFM